MQDHSYSGDKPIAEAQIQQTKARILLTIASLTYVILHGEYFDYYIVEALGFAAFYFIANTAALFTLRRHPFSLPGILFYALLDVSIVTFGMLIDGGHTSGVYFMLLVIIIGNGLRFGNALLLFAQVSCIIWVLAMTMYGHFVMQMELDATLLFWQTFTLIAVPFYVFLIGKKLERAIKGRLEAEETSFHLLDKGPLPVFTFDLDKQNRPRILYVNSAINDVFRRDRHSLIGEGVNLLTLPEDANEMVGFCRDTFEQDDTETHNTPHSVYIRGRDQSGAILKLMCTAICMNWRSRRVGVCFMLDISERENLQEELEAVHRQGYMSTLVAGIVHDFRNVLTNMIGYAEVLQMSSKDETTAKQLEAIIAAGDRGSELITHLLKLSKSSETESLPAFTRGDQIAQPLENIIGLARLQLPGYLKLVCRVEEPLHDVAISMIEIEQILLNLINNSMHAMSEPGQIEVHVGSDPDHKLSKPGHPSLCISVTDSGSGISQEDQEKIFKPFWTSKGGQGGSGLGLTMIQRIIKRNHGSIDVESVPHKQTRFTIHLPAYMPDESAADTAPVAPAGTEAKAIKTKTAGADLSGLHILLVDDVPDILKIHQAMLARMDHTCATAETGKDALELFLDKENHFDLIVTDYRMPLMDGLELVESIRQLGSNIPILMITAFGEDRNLQRAANYNVILMNKPVTMEKLKQGITDAMSI